MSLIEIYINDALIALDNGIKENLFRVESNITIISNKKGKLLGLWQ